MSQRKNCHNLSEMAEEEILEMMDAVSNVEETDEDTDGDFDSDDDVEDPTYTCPDHDLDNSDNDLSLNETEASSSLQSTSVSATIYYHDMNLNETEGSSPLPSTSDSATADPPLNSDVAAVAPSAPKVISAFVTKRQRSRMNQLHLQELKEKKDGPKVSYLRYS